MFQENKFRGVNLVGNTYNLPKSFSTLIYFTGFRKTWILEHSYTVTFPLNSCSSYTIKYAVYISPTLKNLHLVYRTDSTKHVSLRYLCVISIDFFSLLIITRNFRKVSKLFRYKRKKKSLIEATNNRRTDDVSFGEAMVTGS